jgi:hypothetical protein
MAFEADSFRNWLPAPRTPDTMLRGFRWPPEPSEARRLAAREIIDPLPPFYEDPWARFRADSQNFVTRMCLAYVARMDERETLSAWENEGGR